MNAYIYRKVEKLDAGSGDWKQISFFDLKNHDIFRIFEPNGQPVLSKGHQTMIAYSDTYINTEGIPTIQIMTGE